MVANSPRVDGSMNVNVLVSAKRTERSAGDSCETIRLLGKSTIKMVIIFVNGSNTSWQMGGSLT